MSSVGASAAQGLQAGFNMGLQADQFAEQKRRTEVDDARMQEDLGLRRQQAADLAQQRKDALARTQLEDAGKVLDTEYGELSTQLAGLQQSQQPVPPELTSRLSDVSQRRRAHRDTVVAPRLAAEHQEARELFSNAQADPSVLAKVPPAKLYRSISLATGMTPAQIMVAAQGASDVVNGHSANNEAQMLKGANALFARDLKAGVGDQSPYGGHITRKEIIKLAPVQDANGVAHPDKVFPVLRVYTDQVDPTGQPLYYDAPMTEGRGTGPDEKVKAVDLAHAFEYMGNVGTMAQLLQNPDLKARLDEGEKQVGAQTQADVDAAAQYGHSKLAAIKVNSVNAKLQALRAGVADGTISPEDAKKIEASILTGDRKNPTVEPAPAKVTGLQATLDAIDKRTDLTDAEKKVQKDRATPGGASVETAGMRAAAAAAAAKAKGAAAAAGGQVSSRYSTDADYRKSVDTWAETVANGGAMPAGLARADKQMAADIILKAPSFAKEGATGMLAAGAEYKGAQAGARSVGTRSANFELAKSEAYSMADQVVDTSAKFNRTRFTPVNTLISAFESKTGSTEVREMGAAFNSFINAYARAISPVGAPTVSDKSHAREMLSQADSHAQVVAVIGQLKKEMVAAGEAPGAVRAIQRKAIGEGVRATRGMEPVAPMQGSGAPPTKTQGGATVSNW